MKSEPSFGHAAASGPWQLVGQLMNYAQQSPWVDWLELGGSLGRGAGDEFSDVDAGVGIIGTTKEVLLRTAQIADAVGQFAPVAASLIQSGDAFGPDSSHLITCFNDGRQLSLVIGPASRRKALPPECMALLDRSGRLSRTMEPLEFAPTKSEKHEWAFLAWIAISDSWRHASRGRVWRAVSSLDEARDWLWRLWADSLGVTFPRFGLVSVENADLPGPGGFGGTYPTALSALEIHRATKALSEIARTLTAPNDIDDLRNAVTRASPGLATPERATEANQTDVAN